MFIPISGFIILYISAEMWFIPKIQIANADTSLLSTRRLKRLYVSSDCTLNCGCSEMMNALPCCVCILVAFQTLCPWGKAESLYCTVTYCLVTQLQEAAWHHRCIQHDNSGWKVKNSRLCLRAPMKPDAGFTTRLKAYRSWAQLW